MPKIIENVMIGMDDVQEMYNYVEQTKKLINALIYSRDEALNGINQMGDGVKDQVYTWFYDYFEDFSKYIDELNKYNHRNIKYFEEISRPIHVWP